jgi:integrase
MGLSIALSVLPELGIRTSEIDFECGLVKIWDEMKDQWRFVMPTQETLSAIRKYLKSLDKQPQYLFPLATKTAERLIQRYSEQALGFVISWHSLRTTYVSRSVELEQSPAVVMANTGDHFEILREAAGGGDAAVHREQACHAARAGVEWSVWCD